MNLSIGPGTGRTSPVPVLGPGAGAAPAGNRAGAKDERGRLVTAAKEFEAILVQHMLETMRKAKLAEDPLAKGNAASIIHSMQDEAMARSIASGKGLGLADAIVRDLDLRMAKAHH